MIPRPWLDVEALTLPPGVTLGALLAWPRYDMVTVRRDGVCLGSIQAYPGLAGARHHATRVGSAGTGLHADTAQAALEHLLGGAP